MDSDTDDCFSRHHYTNELQHTMQDQHQNLVMIIEQLINALKQYDALNPIIHRASIYLQIIDQPSTQIEKRSENELSTISNTLSIIAQMLDNPNVSMPDIMDCVNALCIVQKQCEQYLIRDN